MANRKNSIYSWQRTGMFFLICFQKPCPRGCALVSLFHRKTSKNMPILCQEYMLFFCLPLSSQPRLNLLSTQQQGRARGGGEWGHNRKIACTQWRTEKIAYTLGRGRAYISDMSSTSGYMGAKYFQEVGPRFFGVSCYFWRVMF